MGVVLSCLASVAALALFALSMTRHHRQAFGRPAAPRTAKVLRLLGGLLLVCAPVPWALDYGPTMALVTWLFCALPLAGLAVVALFTALGTRSVRSEPAPRASRPTS